MIRTLLIMAMLCVTATLPAQTSKAKSEAAAEKIKTLYNKEKFSDIYSMLSDGFKAEINEKEFSDFLRKNIFNSYGEMRAHEYFKEEEKLHSFLVHFKYGDLLMNLNLDEDERVNTLEFLPYKETPKFKNSDYASDNKLETALDSLVEKAVKEYMQSPQNCGLSIGIIQNGRQFNYNYGETHREKKELPHENTIYEIGSVSKTFCGILLAKAIEEKKVKAENDIRLYLPEGKYGGLEIGGEPIRLIHLANHTSGLPRIPDDIEEQPDYNPLNPYKNYSRKMLFTYLEKTELISKPGKICSYSNTGMALLGIILERVYGKPFEALVKEKICQPAGMKNTGIKLSEEQDKLFAGGYNASGKETPHWDLPDLAAAGALRSCSGDMLRFIKYNIEESDAAVKLSHETSFSNGNTIGMGWHIIQTRQGNRLIWHNGGTFGASSFCGFIKEKNCGVIALSNSGMPVDHIALSVLKYLQK